MKKLSESIWSDIQDRSSGETNRKEDDINLLDREGLYDYLIHHYKGTNHFAHISTSISFNTIDIPIIINGGVYRVYFDFNKNEVYVHYATLYMVNKLLIKVSKNFSLRSNSDDHPKTYIISPKDGSKVTNRFFIDVVDFFINNIPDSEGRAIKKIVNESIWSDIQDRSSGEVVRKEDDVNNLDSEGLYEYLKNIYKELDSFQSIKLHPTMNTISVPIFVKGFKPYRVFFEFDNEEIFIEHTMPYVITGFFSKLKGKFHLQQYDTKQGMPAKFYIFPKDGSDITNRFFIEVIDFLLDCIPNSDDKCIERIVNESIWSDIQDRSSGEVIRKEDDVNLLDRDGFYKYIMEHYKTATEDVTGPYSIINSKNADYINIPILENDNILYRVIIFNFDNDPYITIPMRKPFWGSDLFVKIRNNFVLKKGDMSDFSPKFSVWPKGIIKKTELNKFFLEVIDFIIDNAEEPFELLLTRI